MKYFLPFIVFLLLSCNPVKNQNKVNIRLMSTHTEIIIVDQKNNVKVLGQYPFFPGLDLKQIPINRNFFEFKNKNVLILIPDPSVTETIRAWNDFSHLFDVIFINSKEETISLLLKDYGQKIRLVPSPLNECYIFIVNNFQCELILINENGIILIETEYTFKVYPDTISISADNNSCFITHENIENTEIFRLDKNSNLVVPIGNTKMPCTQDWINLFKLPLRKADPYHGTHPE
jgi:hypothetical protein